jgi:RHH-type proline utilization regulon transcriptional repressor/proline dehydrogenase/delta 1-pyrroline-5-carboxylate dehydrogenase
LEVSLATEEPDHAFAARLSNRGKVEVLRSVGTLPDGVLRAAHAAGLKCIAAPVSTEGRIELRYWMREQAVCTTRHRYGQIPSWVPPGRV